MPRVNIAMPTYGSSVRSELMRSFYPLMTGGGIAGCSFAFSEMDYSDIEVSRNYLLSNFYYNKKDCTHLLMVDSDMGFGLDMVRDMIAFDKPVVGALSPRRSIDLRKLHANAGLPYERALARSIEFVGAIREPRSISGSFIRMEACGAGILLITRACVDRMIECLPDIVDETGFKTYAFAHRFERFLTPFDKIRARTGQISEDFAFCRRWVDGCDGEIWACHDRKISHVGSLTVTASYSDRGK